MAHFKDCGNICSVWVEFPRDSTIRRALIVFEVSALLESIGECVSYLIVNAYLYFLQDEEGAKKALEKNGSLLGKDKIRVRHWDGRKFINAVFIGGVPYG